MRLSHPLLSAPLHWKEGRIPVLVVEHPKVFRRMVWELSAQADGEVGDFVLSVDYEPLDCGTHLHVLRDYLALTLDDRKIQNRFQSLLQSLLQEELSAEADRLQQEIARFLETVLYQVDYPISFSAGEYILPLLKAIKLQAALDSEDPLERVMQYLDVYHGLMKQQCFVLVDAHGYFSEEELAGLFHFAADHKCAVMLLEHHCPHLLKEEDACLLDAQLCEMRLDTGEEFA